MPFTPAVASDLIRRTITALADDDVANRMSRSIESVWALTRQNTTTDPPGNHEIVITAVKINVRGRSDRDAGITIFDKQQPVDSGPKPREPIAWGNSQGYCESVTLPIVGTVTACVEYHKADQ
jgi:hypothetical protein